MKRHRSNREFKERDIGNVNQHADGSYGSGKNTLRVPVYLNRGYELNSFAITTSEEIEV